MKKKRKLLFQVGILFVPLILAMIGIIMQAMYRGIVDSYLKARNSQLSSNLDVSFFKIVSLCKDSWFFDYWEDNPVLEKVTLTEGEEEELWGQFSSDEYGTAPWFAAQPEKIQKYCSWVAYMSTLGDFTGNYDWGENALEDNASAETPENANAPEAQKEESQSAYQQYVEEMSSFYMTGKTKEDNYDEMFIIDVNEPHTGFVYFDIGRSGVLRDLGEKMELDLSDHPAIRELLADGKEQITFERIQDFPAEGRFYVGYKPVMIDGKVRAIVGIAYNWSEFSDKIFAILWRVYLLGIGGMIAVSAILMLILYRKVLVPVSRIQQGVCEYAETKDSRVLNLKMAAAARNNELGLLSGSIDELAKEIDHYTEENIRLAGEHARVASELDMARNIQASQLPNIFPPFPDRAEFTIFASMTPAREVGGDFYDFFFVDDDHLALLMADVSGKGVPAALFMMMSRILLANYVLMGLSPGEVLEKTNETICRNNKESMFVTVWLGILEISTGKVTAANAGHEYPIIGSPEDGYELLKDRHGFVVGGMEGVRYRSYEFTLAEEGTLFVYTDGVPEAANTEENLFGTDRLLKALNNMKDEEPTALIEGVQNAIGTFVGEAPQFDDITMMAVQLHGHGNFVK